MIFVLGMHCSGTTMVAQMICVAGFEVGDNLLGADDMHPEGHFERSMVVQLNDKYLHLSGGSWQDPPSFNDVKNIRMSDEDYNKVVAGYQTDEFVIKDPRLCITIPIWHKRFKNSKFVVISRNKDSVAQSLNSRNKFHLGKGRLLWDLYNTHLKHNLDIIDNDRIYLNYDMLVDYQYGVDELACFIGKDGYADEMRNIIKPELRHSNANV